MQYSILSRRHLKLCKRKGLLRSQTGRGASQEPSLRVFTEVRLWILKYYRVPIVSSCRFLLLSKLCKSIHFFLFVFSLNCWVCKIIFFFFFALDVKFFLGAANGVGMSFTPPIESPLQARQHSFVDKFQLSVSQI